MNRFLQNIDSLFNQEFRHLDRVLVFKKLILLFIILNSSIVFFFHEEILGEHSYFLASPVEMVGSKPFLSFWNFAFLIPYNWLLLLLLILFSIICFMGIRERLMTFLVFLFWINFLNRTTVINTGGEVLIGLFLFYLLFIGEPKSKDRNIILIQNALNNTFFYAIIIQFLSVYIISSWWKLLDESWLSGLAFLYAINIDTYSFFGFGQYLYDHILIAQLLTYVSIFYQILFPILIWSKKIKKPLLILGVGFHLGIAIIMGIFSFGLIMILSYSIFLDKEQLKWLKDKVLLSKAIKLKQ